MTGHIPSGHLDNAGTEAADRVSPVGASVSLPGSVRKRTSFGAGKDGAALRPVDQHTQRSAGVRIHVELQGRTLAALCLHFKKPIQTPEVCYSHL